MIDVTQTASNTSVFDVSPPPELVWGLAVVLDAAVEVLLVARVVEVVLVSRVVEVVLTVEGKLGLQILLFLTGKTTY
jgi:hypothetical protein